MLIAIYIFHLGILSFYYIENIKLKKSVTGNHHSYYKFGYLKLATHLIKCIRPYLSLFL